MICLMVNGMNNLISEYNGKECNRMAFGQAVTGELLGGIRLYLYEKKIVYLTLSQNGIKKASAGFARVSREKDAFVVDIHIKSEGIFFGKKYSLCLISDGREIEWGTITGQQGRADAHRSLALQKGVARFGEEEFKEEDLYGLLIRLDDPYEISGRWQEDESNGGEQKSPEVLAADRAKKNLMEKASAKEKNRKGRLVPAEEVSMAKTAGETDAKKETRRLEEERMAVHMAEREEEPEGFFPQPAAGDKWEQLLRSYKNVHPFGDERVFLSIEPKDFVVLQAPYQRLVNNSFLLHGFYNYRHMILGPDKELGNGDGSCFYLGVPGTYFEREKMVAVMFGFEGFECDGAVEIGKFGYYMRRVEL